MTKSCISFGLSLNLYHVCITKVSPHRLVPSSDPPWPVQPATLCHFISTSCGQTRCQSPTVQPQIYCRVLHRRRGGKALTFPLASPWKPSWTAKTFCPWASANLTADLTAAFIPAAGAPTFRMAREKLVWGNTSPKNTFLINIDDSFTHIEAATVRVCARRRLPQTGRVSGRQEACRFSSCFQNSCKKIPIFSLE